VSGQWAQSLSAVAAGLSSIIALVAILIAVRNDRRSREVTKTQIFLALRDRFLDIYEKLGDLDKLKAIDEDKRAAREAYWHHAFSEWYVCKNIAPHEMGGMWYSLYKGLIKSGYDHPALKATLAELTKHKEKGFGEYAQQFVFAVKDEARPERSVWKRITSK
jgi:hypothetical protein